MPGQILRACANPNCCQPFKPRHARHRYCGNCGAKPTPSPTTRTRPSSSTERARIRAAVLARDPQCQLTLPGCTGTSEVAAHVLDAADGGRYVEDNLVGSCNHCNSALGGRRAHRSAHAEQARDGGAAPDNVGESGGQPPPLYTRLR